MSLDLAVADCLRFRAKYRWRNAGNPPILDPLASAHFPAHRSEQRNDQTALSRECEVFEDGPPCRVSNATAGMVDQVGNPHRVGAASPEDPPGGPDRLKRSVPHTPAKIGDAAVSLDVVAPTTGRYDVLPHMQAPATPGDNVVEAGGWQVAVDASPPIPSEDRASGERDSCTTRHAHVANQPNH